MRLRKRIGVNAAAVCRRDGFQTLDSQHDHLYNVKNPRKTLHSLMHRVHNYSKS